MKNSVAKNTQKPKKKVSKRAIGLAANENRARFALLNAAKQLFAKHGLRGTSIRDIAQAAQVNSSMISYYFGGKEGLYKECVRLIGEDRLNMAVNILAPPENPEEYRVRLKMFIENLFTLLLEDRYAGLIIMREFDRAKSPAGALFKSGFLRVFDLLRTFFQQSQDKKIIKAHHDPLLLTSVFFGTIINQMRMDHIVQRNYGRSLKDPKTRLKPKNSSSTFSSTSR
ncbi:MAG: TetR family transcriptional regulator [Bdellovibrionales bacterium]